MTRVTATRSTEAAGTASRPARRWWVLAARPEGVLREPECKDRVSSTGDVRVITFNDILRAGGIDPDAARVKLLRHIETRNRIDVHDVWRNQRGLFEAWQARQWDDFFNGVDYVAPFVVNRAGETVFVGLYAVGG